MAQFEPKRKKKLCTNEVGGVKMKKKNHVSRFKENIVSLLLFFACSIGFAFPR
jgi:hypothetical protein